MKFCHKNTYEKKLADGLTVLEYEKSPFNIDGAIAYLDGVFGPKKNKTFTELFYVVEGEVEIKSGNKIETLIKDDFYVMKPNITHILVGKKAKLFIVCNPPFDSNEMEIINN